MAMRTLVAAVRAMIRAVEAVQVELHGTCSISRLLGLDCYTKEAKLWRVFKIILLTPLPCMLVTTAIDLVPLDAPAGAIVANSAFWCRLFIGVCVGGSCVVEQVHCCFPGLPLTITRKLGTSVLASAATVAVGVCLSRIIGFPIPFAQQLLIPTMLLVLCLGVRGAWYHLVARDSKLVQLFKQLIGVIIVNGCMILVYPVFSYVFTTLDGYQQVVISLLLPGMKLTAKNLLHYAASQFDDVKSLVVIVNADVFHAMFVAFVMQSGSTMKTTIPLVVFDVVQICFTMNDVASWIHSLDNLALQLGRDHESQLLTDSHYGRTAQLIEAMPTLREADQIKITRQMPPCCRSRQIQSVPASSALPPIRKSIAPHGIDVVPGPIPELLCAQIELQYVHGTLRLMYLVECAILVEFTEVFIPLVYALSSMDDAHLSASIVNVVAYAGLEFISFVAVSAMLYHKLKFSPLVQLAFVLEKHVSLIQSLLIQWVYFAVQGTLVHFAAEHSHLDSSTRYQDSPNLQFIAGYDDMIVMPPPLDDSSTALLATTLGALVAGLLYIYAARGPSPPPGITPRKIHRPNDTLPLLGNALSFYRHRHNLRAWGVQQCLEFNGEPWVRKIPGQPEMITFSLPEAIEEITTTQFENFEKGEYQIDIIRTLFGRGIVASDGERWVHQRKAAVKFFSARSLRTLMHRSLHKNLEQVCDVLDSAQRSGEQVDLKKLFHELTLQTFVEMGLGVQLNWIGSKDQHPFQTSIDAASTLLTMRFKTPGVFWRLQRWLNVGTEAKLAHHMSVVYAWLQEVIAQGLVAATRAREANDSNESKSIIELFVQHSDEDKDGLRAGDLADFMLTFVIAARDTTASTLAWLFYALSHHPEVEQKICEELQQAFPDIYGRNDVLLSTDQIKALPYLEATIRETLRLYPAAPSTAKVVVRDTVVCGDVFLRKGQFCILHAYAMARNPRVWGDDAADFKPERWIDPATGELRQVPPSKFFTFHAGPRTCIGMTLALLELRAVAANLLNRYHFRVDPANDGTTAPGLTLMMQHALLAAVTPVA